MAARFAWFWACTSCALACIETRKLPVDTRERVSHTLLTLEELPRAGKQLSGVWRDCRAVVGPWGWLIVVYMYIEAEDRVVVIAFHDARTSDAAIVRAGSSPRLAWVLSGY